MPTIFPLSASVGQTFSGYEFDGISWNIIGIDLTQDYATQVELNNHESDTTNVHGIANTAILATQTYADNAATAAAANIVDSAPSTLNTLNELAAALGDDANFATTVTNSIAGKAPLASPTFTGTVSASAVNISIADTATAASHYIIETGSDGVLRPKTLANVRTEIVTNDAVNSASATVLGTVTSGTWNASTISATYIDSAIARLASPALTGTPTAPTAAVDTNTTQIATTAFVQQSLLTTVNAQNTSYTLVLSDTYKMIEINNSASTTLFIPLESSVAFPIGTTIPVLQTGAGQVTIAGVAGVTVNATPGLKLRSQWSSVTIIKRSANTWVALGDLTA